MALLQRDKILVAKKEANSRRERPQNPEAARPSLVVSEKTIGGS